MSFLSVLKKIGSVSLNVAEKVTSVASNPTIETIVGATPIGAPFLAAVHILTTLEGLAPQAGLGASKAAIATPAIQAIFPGASEAAVSGLITDMVTAMNKFSAAAPATPA